MRLFNYCTNKSTETIFINTENNRANVPHKFVLKLRQRLDFKNSDKYVALQNLSIYYKWKNIRQQYKNNKLKITAPMCNDEFELLNGSYSVSDIQDYIQYILKKHETLTDNLPFIFTSIGLIID